MRQENGDPIKLGYRQFLEQGLNDYVGKHYVPGPKPDPAYSDFVQLSDYDKANSRDIRNMMDGLALDMFMALEGVEALSNWLNSRRNKLSKKPINNEPEAVAA